MCVNVEGVCVCVCVCVCVPDPCVFVCADGWQASRLVSGSLSGRYTGSDELLDSFGTSVGSPSLVIRGSVRNVNRALRAVRYMNAPFWNGPVIVRVTIDDLGNTGAAWLRDVLVCAALNLALCVCVRAQARVGLRWCHRPSPCVWWL